MAARSRDLAGLERKLRSAGRPWTLAEVVMTADGQWAVGAASRRTASGPERGREEHRGAGPRDAAGA
ncbi:hypothetical protein ACFYUY_23120 [Kitasatospora sp. NPDC004745]|uniref:hypothetical protein n=1 Tax=unclassified Kitasatospora TaxID=2633591 RepID=UPI00369E4916